jgi:hypothetical protein
VCFHDSDLWNKIALKKPVAEAAVLVVVVEEGAEEEETMVNIDQVHLEAVGAVESHNHLAHKLGITTKLIFFSFLNDHRYV